MFDQIDKDGSGLIDLLELKRFFRGSLDAGKLDQMFADLDEDGSGEIDREEWRVDTTMLASASLSSSGRALPAWARC